MNNYPKVDEKRLLSEPDYKKQWVEAEVKRASEWFMKQIGMSQ